MCGIIITYRLGDFVNFHVAVCDEAVLLIKPGRSLPACTGRKNKNIRETLFDYAAFLFYFRVSGKPMAYSQLRNQFRIGEIRK